jgi:TonB family protein
MTDLTDLDEGSVVEYSLAELGFVLVFVLLLLSGWEINTNAANLDEEEKNKAQLQEQMEIVQHENETLKAAIATFVPDETELSDDFMFVDKKEYLLLQSQADAGETLKNLEPPMLDAIVEWTSTTESPPDDPIIVSEGLQSALEDTLKRLKQDNERMVEELASMAENPIEPSNDGGKIGTIGFCTYESPDPNSGKVYGKSVALGTLLVEEDGITLVSKNSAIQHRNFVDIAGEIYDTSLVTDELEQWPLKQKLSPREFQRLGSKFVAIGDLPSDKREACRFGMDYYMPIYSEKSFGMLKGILEGSFYKNAQVSEASFNKRFSEYNVSSKQNISESPVDEIDAESKISQPLALSSTSSKVISKVAPIYPRTAERKGSQGVVELSYRVSTSGRAISIEVVQEVPLGKGFAEASIAALKQYKFSSATENGVKVISEKKVQKFTFK